MWIQIPFYNLLLLSLVLSKSDAQVETALKGLVYFMKAYEFVSSNLGDKSVSNEERNFQSLKNDLRDIKLDFKNMELHLPTEVNIRQRLHAIRMKFSYIDRRYDEYVKYKRNRTRYETDTLDNFAEKTANDMPEKLHEIYDDVVALHENSLVTLMEKYIDNLDPYCGRLQSRQRYFYDFFCTVLSYEIKGIVSLKYAHELKYQNTTHDTHVQERKDWKKQATEIIKETIEAFKGLMSRAERDMWKCDPKTPVENKTFVELKLFQRVLYQGADFATRYCPATQKDQSVQPITHSTRQRHCNNLVYCRTLENTKPITACILKDQSQRRRYSAATSEPRNFWEILLRRHSIDCDENSDKTTFESAYVVTSHRSAFRESGCDCICHELQDSDRYISLEPVISDVERNFIITGVKLVLVNHTIHIQIQQGKLNRYGLVDRKSVEWKNIEPISGTADLAQDEKEKYKIRDTFEGKQIFKLDWYDKRGLYLDDMDFEENKVVVGLRFGLVQESNSPVYVKLDTMAMRFNFGTGQLNHEEFTWWSSKQDTFTRTPLRLYELSSPTSLEYDENKPDGEAHQSTEFAPSAYSSKDAGQSTLPFIDIQPVVSDPPVPLSGVSMDIKHTVKSGGYLILKTKTYNVLENLDNTTEE
ncbi:uncharacterized protein LOC111643285 [Copidosoma floridanum]|uniref:uncharacterized protein LOC111643285 n=1 Tax=Copidosoma floridanum TaxID=29053 RepID=UPI000C6FB82A|nr:uncharacterized protein LOC111643285 [Copidosoma floridanum]